MVLIFLPGSVREALVGAVRGTVLRPVLALQRSGTEREALLADPVRLRAERDSLAAFLVGNMSLEEENSDLRDLLSLRARLPRSFIPAELIRIPGRGLDGLFLLTTGARQGVRPGSPVVAPGGLVGQVLKVSAGTTEGMDWTSPNFGASAMTVDGDVYGLVEPRLGDDGESLLALTGTAFHTELEEGTLIVTSGRGGVYPRGIPIGTVLGLEESQAGWRKSYLLRPMVSPAEMSYVLILGEPDPELAGKDLAASWGIRPPGARRDTTAVDGDAAVASTAGAAVGAVPVARPAATRAAPAVRATPPPSTTRGGIRLPTVTPSASGRAAPTIVTPGTAPSGTGGDTTFREEGE